MKLFFPLIFIALTCLSLDAQNAVLSGVITDAATSEPLIGATVSIGEIGEVTEIDGSYEISIAPGTYTVKFNYIGYEEREERLTLSAGDRRTFDVQLAVRATLLQTATVTSGKYEKPLSEVTVSMEVLKPGLVESVNTVSVDEVLEKVPGVNIIDGQANIRGGSGFSYGAGSRVLLLVDDIPILQADAGFPQWNDVPIENIEQIEVVKGAASALYGSSAMNGIINIRTGFAKSKPEFKASIFHQVYGDPRDTSAVWWQRSPFRTGSSLAYKQKFGRFDLAVAGFALNEHSYNEATGESYQRINANMRYRFTDRLSIGLSANFNTGRNNNFFFWRNAEDGVFQADPRTLSFSRRTRYNIDPSLTYFDGLGNRHKILSRFYSVNNDVNNNQGNQSQVRYAEYQFQRQLSNVGLVFTAGYVIQDASVDAELYGNSTYTSFNQAAYAQLEQKLFDRLNLSAGFRYEANRINNPGFTYFNGLEDIVIEPSVNEEAKPVLRFGANYQAARATYIRGSWGQGYRYPTIAETYIVTTFGGVPISPNPDLQSETGWSAELGVKQGFRISNFEGFVDLVGFYSAYQDMMEFNFVNIFPTGFQSQNVGDTYIGGGEITVAGQGKLFGLPTSLLAGYTYIDPKFAEFDATPPIFGEVTTEAQLNAINSSADFNILKYRSQHTFKFDIETRYRKLSAGLAVFYASHMEAVDAIFENLVVPGLRQFRESNNKGYQVYNLRVAYNFTDRQKLSFLINNILNTAYSIRPGLMEAPINFTMRFDYGF